jgi:hypothetical protein
MLIFSIAMLLLIEQNPQRSAKSNYMDAELRTIEGAYSYE